MKKYFSLVLFAHTVFAMPFAVIGFFLAISTTGNEFNWIKLFLMLLCMVFARNAAMAFNRYLDRDIDAQNPRTVIRDIPAGRISSKEALAFTLINSLLFVLTTLLINRLCFYLTPLCHLILGLGLSLAPIGAYLVVAGEFAMLPVYFSLAVLCWVSGFDIIYALQDEEFDKENKLNSIPAWLGRKKALQVSSILHFLAIVFVSIPYIYSDLSWFYLAGILFFILLLAYQHQLVKPDDLSKVNRAFFTTNGIASVVFALFFLLDAYLRNQY
jgi:4-hydroxybenzoate polyprenyltransferase